MEKNARTNNYHDRPHNVTKTVALFPEAKTPKYEYDKQSLLDILSDIKFDKISIPLYTYKNLIFDGGIKGTIAVGYIKDFNPETEEFTVVIFGKNAESVCTFEDPVIYPRVYIDNETEDVKSIIGLDICPSSFYSNIL